MYNVSDNILISDINSVFQMIKLYKSMLTNIILRQIFALRMRILELFLLIQWKSGEFPADLQEKTVTTKPSFQCEVSHEKRACLT